MVQALGECFSNIDMASNIGNEEEWAKHSFSELASAGLEVEYLTTGPDSSSYRAAMRLYADGVTSVEPKHLLDTRHVSHNHRKYIKNMSELTIHMPTKFKNEKQKMQDFFRWILQSAVRQNSLKLLINFIIIPWNSKQLYHTHVMLLLTVIMATMTYAISIHLCAWKNVIPPGLKEVHFCRKISRSINVMKVWT